MLYQHNPRAFDAYDGGTELRDAAASYTHLTADRGLSGEEATRRIMASFSPERIHDEKVLGPAADKFVKELKPSEVRSALDDDWIPLLTPSAGYTPAMEASLMADYREIAREKFLESGDAEMAKAQALAEIKRLYGVTRIGGSRALMKYRPENHYPTIDGSHDYLAEAVKKDAEEAAGKPVENAFLVSTRETAEDVRNGEPPRYRLFYTENIDGQEIVQEVHEGLFQIPREELRTMFDDLSEKRRRNFERQRQGLPPEDEGFFEGAMRRLRTPPTLGEFWTRSTEDEAATEPAPAPEAEEETILDRLKNPPTLGEFYLDRVPGMLDQE